MADDVSITFSAQIGQLISGVDQVKDAINSIATPVNALASVFTGFGEAFAAAFAIDQIAQFVSQMDELGTSTLRTAAMLGVSTTEAQELGFIAKATGGSSEELATAMERLQVNLQKAQSGAGPAAEALQALGLRAKDLIGLPLDEQLNKIADAVSRFADGGNKTAIVIDLLGRSGAQMIPILDQGSAGLERLRETSENAAAVVTQQTIRALDSAGTASTVLKASIVALGESIIGAFSPAIIEASQSLTQLVSGITALIESGNLSKAVMDQLSTALHTVAVNLTNIGLVINDVLSGHWVKAAQDWLAGNEEIKNIQLKSDADLLSIVTESRKQLQAALAVPQGGNLPQAPALAVPNKDALNAALADAQEQMKLADEVYKQQAEKLNSEFKLHQITESEKTTATLAALEDRHGAELAALAEEESVVGLSKDQYQRIQNEKTQADQRYASDHQKIIDQALQEEASEYNKVFSSITGAFNSQLRGLLSGQETFGQAFKKIIGDLLIDVIQFLEKWATEHAATMLANLAVTQATAAAQATAQTAGQAATLPARAAKFTSDVMADAAEVFAGVFANLAPLLGPAAAGPAAASQAVVLAQLGNVPKLDVGTDLVVRQGLAVLHPGEVVQPAQTTGPYTGSGNSGGSAINLNIGAPLVGTTAFINQIMPQLARALFRYQGLNPSTVS